MAFGFKRRIGKRRDATILAKSQAKGAGKPTQICPAKGYTALLRRGTLMGATQVTVTIRNPAQPSRSWESLFLVDTGATDSVVPRSCIEAIGLKPEGQRIYELADGREVKLDFARAFIEFMGDLTAGRVVIADGDVEPLLGVTALESAGIEVDPVNQRLKRLPALRLKSQTVQR